METKNDTQQVFQLNEYLLDQFNSSLFMGYSERVLLADEFINCFNDVRLDSKKKAFWKYTPLLNIDEITMQKCEADDICEVSPYTFVFLDEIQSVESKEYTNYAFGPSKLFVKKKLQVKESNSLISDALKHCSEEDIVYIIARIAFNICFCVHPFKGRKYFELITRPLIEEREFFKSSLKHIFILNDNENRFVNGFHEDVWALWSKSSKEQQKLWNAVFSGKINNFKNFLDEWRHVYTFKPSESKTPCGEIIASMIFNDNCVLLCSDNTIGNKKIFCYKCNNMFAKKCKLCSVASNKMYANFVSMQLNVIEETKHIMADGKEEKITKEREILVYDKKSIKRSDLIETDKDEVIFKIIASKKANILGAKNLLEYSISATCGKQCRNFEKNAVIALLLGTRITISEGLTLVVPGEPIENSIGDKKNTPPAVNPVAKPMLPPIKPIIQPSRQHTAVDLKAPPVQDDCVLTEIGNIYKELRLASSFGLLENHDIMCTKTNKKYSLWVFNSQSSRENNFINNIEAMIHVFNLNTADAIGTVKQEGFCKGKLGYILPLPNKEPKFINNRDASVFKRKMVNEFSKLFKKLIDLRFDCKDFMIENFYCNEVNNPNQRLISKGSSSYMDYKKANSKICPADKISDCYILAVLLFVALFNINIFEPEKPFTQKSILGKKNSNFKNSFLDSKDRAVELEGSENVPDYILDLVDRTFTKGILSKKYEIMSDKDKAKENSRVSNERLERPTADDWCHFLIKWLQSGVNVKKTN